MPSITRKQYEDITKKCSNGFYLDVKHYVCFGEKDLVKEVKISEKDYVEVKIYFSEEYENFRTIGYVPVVRFSILHEINNDFGGEKSEYKLYHTHEIKSMEYRNSFTKRRNMSVLYALTKEYTDENILDVSEVAEAVAEIRKKVA